MIGSKNWITLTSVALSGAICAAPLFAQNQGRSTGGNTNSGTNKPGVFRSFFQNAFGRNASNEPDPENEPEAPPVNSTKPRTMPKASNNFKQPSKISTPPIEPNDDGGPRSFFNRPQPTNSTSTISSVARNVCLCHPDARREMIAALNDRSEARRLAAVQALVSVAHHQCPQCGRSPCDDDVVAQILADIAYGKDASSRWLEPSENVRYTAREALRFSHREVDTAPPVQQPPGQSLMPSKRPQAGSFVSDDDNAAVREEPREMPRSTQTRTAPVNNNLPSSNPNRSTFGNRPPTQSRTLSNAPAAVVSDDPVDPPRPTPSNSRSGVGLAVPGRGGNTSPTRITNPTISDDPPARESKTIESEPIPDRLDATRRSNAPSRLISPELDTTSPAEESTALPAPRGGAVIVEDAPPSLPDSSATRRSPQVDDAPIESNSSDSGNSGKVSSRRGKRSPSTTIAAPAPVLPTPTAPALTPSPIPAQPAPTLNSSSPTPAPVTSLTPGLGTPSGSPTPSEPAPSPAAPTLVTPAPVSPSPAPMLVPTPSNDENAPTAAPVRSSTPSAAPIRSVGPSGGGAPSLAPKASADTTDSDKAPTLAPTPAGGPQLGPAAKKPTLAPSQNVIRSSFDMSPARGSRISAYDENAAAPVSRGTSTITIK